MTVKWAMRRVQPQGVDPRQARLSAPAKEGAGAERLRVAPVPAQAGRP